MARFKILHEGTTLKGLKGTIKYNSKDKIGINSKKNPRLISVISNCGFCKNVNDSNDYMQLVDNFTLSVQSNAQLATNSRQKYLYEHSMISFSIEDDAVRSLEQLQYLALETCKTYDPSFEDIPYMLFPQQDSGKIHFHIVRGFHDESGKYHRKVQSGRKMEAAAQKIERKHNLTLTGNNNPANYIIKNGKKVYFPQYKKDSKKLVKNKIIDIESATNPHLKRRSKIDSKIKTNNFIMNELTSVKNNVTNETFLKIKSIKERIYLLENNSYTFIQRTFRNDEYNDSQDVLLKKFELENIKKNALVKIGKINISGTSILSENKRLESFKAKDDKVINASKVKVNLIKKSFLNIDDFKFTINDAYRNSKSAIDFVNKINMKGIDICVSKRDNGMGGITFASDHFSMAAGKVNSYLTYGKIKRNDPELFDFLNNLEGLSSLVFNMESPSVKPLNIKVLNRNYKQYISDEGDTLIYYKKKNNDQYPNNYNLKINNDKTKISIGQRSNEHDIKLVYDIAKQSGWTNAKSSSKELIQRSMRVAYAENKSDLFFFSTHKPSLTMSDLKSIVGNDRLSKDNLIKLYDSDLIVESERNEMRIFVMSQLKLQNEDVKIIGKLLDNRETLRSSLDVDNSSRKKMVIIEYEDQKKKILKKLNVDSISISSPYQKPSDHFQSKLKPY
ncbi:hypothetical protein H5125_12795 [Shewanella sp. SR44-4]|uniref:relaxase/mobilization nuclease domain-containing protein n=1 Tax=Shewanella sp. SR44-4 TaxID=2760935 RepID=UPI0015FF664B|nr:hypothetical protein [Shewanella sp. SR44-4]MBB1363022.1 hypothetical protein [Shewanella sp. SR44-4]